MGLLQIVQSAVKTAHKVTLDLQASFTFEKYLSSDGAGDNTFSSPVMIRAIIEEKQEIVKTLGGEMSQSKTHITVLDTEKLLLATGGEGVKEQDRIVLQNGETGVILNYAGLMDRSTGGLILTEIYLG